MATVGRRVVFLDRDGTINVDHGYVYRWQDWQFLGGALRGLQRLGRAGFELVVVTNQSGVGRGYYTEGDVQTLHARVDLALRAEGIVVSTFCYCPHAPDVACECRKPRTGMIRDWLTTLPAAPDYSACWTIGDRATDVGFGQQLGTRTILLSPSADPAVEPRPSDGTFLDLGAAADYICDEVMS